MISGDRTFQGTDRFRVERCLGRGAFGVVYLVYDLKHGRHVALKALRQVDPDPLYRFKQEFRSLADIQHPNLVRLHELLSDGERWFFTMELVDGTTFLNYVAGRSGTFVSDDDPTQIIGSDVSPGAGTRLVLAPNLDPERLRVSVKQLAEGLNTLHASGKMHRDIKPANVLVTRSGRVVILDFGLVKELAADTQKPSGVIVGTPAYMSPEQAADLSVTAKSDWYSVGVMVYEALTGRLPFSGRASEVLARKLQIDPPRPEEIAADIPPDLSTLCMALLRRDPAQRPAGAEVLRALHSRVPGTIFEPAAFASPRSVFVGRAAHLNALSDAFFASRSEAVTVLVHGSSGMGKTTVVQHFLEQLRGSVPDVVILSGRCYEQESVPYKGLDSLMDALSSYLKDLDDPVQRALLPRDSPALARLFPVLQQARGISNGQQLHIADSVELRRRAFVALRELLARLAAGRPLVLFIDDLQWSDHDSVLLIDEICRQPDAPKLLLVVTYRTEEIDTSAPLKSFLESCHKAPRRDVRELIVSRLPPDEAKALAALLTQADEFRSELETIARESGGSPFFVHELVRFRELQRRSGSPAASGENTTLDGVIRARLAQISPSARILAELLAAAGQPVDRVLLAGAAQLDNHAEAIDSLRDQHLVRSRSTSDTEQLELYHARIGEGILAGMNISEQRARHAALAVWFEAWGLADPETLFFHFLKAGDELKAARYVVAAASQAEDALAFDRAARLYRKAIELHAPGENALRVKLGAALANAGRGEEAAVAYLRAAEQESHAQQIELRRRAYEQLLRSGHIDEGLKVLRDVLAALKMKLPDTPTSALLSLILHRLYLRFRGLDFRERTAESIPPEELLRVDVCRSVAQGLGIVDNVRGADFQARHLIRALRAGELDRIVRALGFEVAFIANAGGRRRDKIEQLRRLTGQLIQRINSPQAAGEMNLTSGLAAYLMGEWHSAVEYLQRAEKILVEQCTGVAAELNGARNFYSEAMPGAAI